MANFNKVFLMGNLTRDPELRFTTSGSPVTNLSVAINRTYTDKNGEKRDETCFATVTVWGRQAETSAEYLSKGRPVFIQGRLRNRDLEIGEGKKRTILEVTAEQVQFLGRSDRQKETITPDNLEKEGMEETELEKTEEESENSKEEIE